MLETVNETVERDVGRLVKRVAAGTVGRQTADGLTALHTDWSHCSAVRVTAMKDLGRNRKKYISEPHC